MNKKVRFRQLRQFLLDLGFSESRLPTSALVFAHEPSDTLLFYHPYEPDGPVNPGDLATTRRFLDERGLLATDEFEQALHKAPV
jgi:hypothetical protein